MKAFCTKALFVLSFMMVLGIQAVAAVGTHVADSLNCAQLNNAKRYIGVYLPPNYSVDSTYPSVYYLHGAGGQVTPTDNSILYFKPLFDTLMSQGKIPKMIIIAVDGNPHLPNPSFAAGWYTNSVLNGKMEDYLTLDVIPYVDGKYRTKNNRSFRGIMGHSMGGYGTLKLGMKHSDLFGGLASLSGLTAFDKYLSDVTHDKTNTSGETDSIISWGQNLDYAMSGAFSPNLSASDSINHIFDGSYNVVSSVRATWLAHDCYTLLDTYANQLKTMSVYVNCGAYDELNFDAHARLIDQKMTSLSIPHTFQIYGNLSTSTADRADHNYPLDRGFVAWNNRTVNNPAKLDSNAAAYGLRFLGASFTSSASAIRYQIVPGNNNFGFQMHGTQLQLDLPQAGDVLLRAVDPLGRTVYIHRAQNQASGALSLSLPKGLSAQSYIISLTHDGNEVARRIVFP